MLFILKIALVVIAEIQVLIGFVIYTGRIGINAESNYFSAVVSYLKNTWIIQKYSKVTLIGKVLLTILLLINLPTIIAYFISALFHYIISDIHRCKRINKNNEWYNAVIK